MTIQEYSVKGELEMSDSNTSVLLGIGFGCALAIAISWLCYHSVWWAIEHGIVSWLFVIWWCLFGEVDW